MASLQIDDKVVEITLINALCTWFVYKFKIKHFCESLHFVLSNLAGHPVQRIETESIWGEPELEQGSSNIYTDARAARIKGNVLQLELLKHFYVQLTWRVLCCEVRALNL